MRIRVIIRDETVEAVLADGDVDIEVVDADVLSKYTKELREDATLRETDVAHFHAAIENLRKFTWPKATKR